MGFEFLNREDKNEISIIKINRPAALNALNVQLLEELSAMVSELEKGNTRIMILSGEGKAFVAGADIAAMKEFGSKEAEKFSELGQSTFNKIDQSPIVSIAAVNGFALGGGMELALSCDIRIGSNFTKMGLPEVSLGLLPGFGGTQRLARLIGPGRALELVLSGDMIGSDDAYRLGILNRLVSPEELLTESEKLAKVILTRGPRAVKEAKMALKKGFDQDMKSGLETEKKAFAGLFDFPESKEGLSAFLEKRKPNF